jgi:hypothetical protein
MEREILTYPISRTQLNDELAFMVEYFSNKGIEKCSILFGFAWGMEYYPGNEWNDEEIPISELIDKVHEVEASGIGAVGKDDLFVKVQGLEFRFCNDSDLHIYFSSPNDDIEFYYSRWKQLGYQPAEWLKTQEKGPGDRVRFN